MKTDHRVAIEERSGIWLLFYETLHQGYYKQRLIRIFGYNLNSTVRFIAAERAALFVISDRKVECELIVRDNQQRNVMIRC